LSQKKKLPEYHRSLERDGIPHFVSAFNIRASGFILISDFVIRTFP